MVRLVSSFSDDPYRNVAGESFYHGDKLEDSEYKLAVTSTMHKALSKFKSLYDDIFDFDNTHASYIGYGGEAECYIIVKVSPGLSSTDVMNRLKDNYQISNIRDKSFVVESGKFYAIYHVTPEVNGIYGPISNNGLFLVIDVGAARGARLKELFSRNP